eukprot:GFUD01019369.1.p1 GENE.GFUD01019369.1~~GFUD01019369.1.p1  ORF type:complete len:256 (+),score=60.74 GFUD01019369.1:55-822(+)
MAVAFIQGASRGIGLEFARALSARGNVRVVAGCRDPDGAQHLHQLENVTVMKCDVTNESDLKTVSSDILTSFGKLDFAINVSGILHPSGRGETRLQDVTLEALQETFLVNTFGPLIMAKHLGPLLQKGDGLIGTQSSKGKNSHSGVLAHISARVGSISDNRLGGWYGYRMSKSALNMANKNLSLEFGRGKSKLVCLVLHPGTTDTDLSRPYHKGVPNDKLFSTEFSVMKMMQVIDSASLEDTGRYIAWDGTDIPY